MIYNLSGILNNNSSLLSRYQNSIKILENIKKKLREMKQDKSALPEGEYKEFKTDMLPFAINLLINDRDESFLSNPTVSRKFAF
ncbi:Protein Wnt-16 [Dirofilaria immitis]